MCLSKLSIPKLNILNPSTDFLGAAMCRGLWLTSKHACGNARFTIFVCYNICNIVPTKFIHLVKTQTKQISKTKNRKQWYSG